jgi:hypothetical protein
VLAAVAALAVAAAVLVTGLAVVRIQAAPSSAPVAATPTRPSPDTSEPTPGKGWTMRPGDGWGPGGAPGLLRGHGPGEWVVSELADKLGVDESAVRSAMRDAMDSLTSEWRSGDRSGPPPWAGGPGAMRDSMVDAFAEALGVSPDEVASALEEIRSEARAGRAAALQERLDHAVADGTLTQDEADAVMKAAREGVIPMGAGPRFGGDD